MLQAPEPQQLTEQFASVIADLRTIARMHALPMGSPERLQALPLRLAKDVRLRSDLTEQVRSLQLQDSELGLPDVLSLLLIAIGGSASIERRRDMEEVVDLTGGFLASLGGWPGSDVEPLIDIDNPPDHDPRLDLAASGYSEELPAKPAPQPAPQDEGNDSAAKSVETVTSAAAGSVTLAEITHALARLERGNLELRLHLDSIDQRICRMEPLLEAVPSVAPVEGAPARPEPPVTVRALEPIDPVPPAIARASVISEYELQRQREEEIKVQRRISLTSNFADPVPEALRAARSGSVPQRQGAAVLTGARPLPSAAGAVSSTRVSPPRRDRFAAARELPGTLADDDPLYAATDAELAQARQVSPVELPEAPPEARDVRDDSPAAASSSSKIPAPDEVYRQPEAPAPEMTAPPKRLEYLNLDPAPEPLIEKLRPRPESLPEVGEPASRRAGVWIGSVAAVAVLGAAGFLYVNGLPSMVTGWVSGSGSTASSVSGESAPSTTAAQPGTTSAQSAGSGRPATSGASSAGRTAGAHDRFSPNANLETISGPTFVPGGVMDGYLIAAPRPQYPQLAGLANVQGKISFEAMISKTGEVEALKVLGGPQLLRSAATDAVKQWQYRPFEVKGRPVEVRTIIRVDVASHTGEPAAQ